MNKWQHMRHIVKAKTLPRTISRNPRSGFWVKQAPVTKHSTCLFPAASSLDAWLTLTCRFLGEARATGKHSASPARRILKWLVKLNCGGYICDSEVLISPRALLLTAALQPRESPGRQSFCSDLPALSRQAVSSDLQGELLFRQILKENEFRCFYFQDQSTWKGRTVST